MTSRIGFLNDQRLFRASDGMYAETPFIRFLLGFAEHFDEVVLLSRVFDVPEEPTPLYRLPDEKVRVVRLPPYPRIVHLYTHRMRYMPGIERVLKQTLPDLDALWLNFGHPVSLKALKLSDKIPRLRCFGVMRGAYERDARIRSGGPPMVGWVAEKVMRNNLARFSRMAANRRIPCFAYGQELVQRLDQGGLRVYPFMDSLLHAQDIDPPPAYAEDLAADLLFVGRLTPEKGLDILLKAMSSIETPEGEPTLRVVGSGPQEEELREQITSLGLDERVIMDGHVDFGPELFQRYTSAKLLVMPSRTEGVPKTACEAMAFGTPVVGTAVGGLPDLIGRSRQRGQIVPVNDPGTLAKTLTSLLADPEGLSKMGEEARAYAAPITLERQVQEMMSHLY